MRHIYRIIPIILLLSLSISSQGQLLDSISASFQYKPKPSLQFNTRNAFITSQVVKMRGINLGLNYNQTTKVGIGFNWLGTEITKEVYHEGEDVETKYDANLKFWFISPYFEYAFYRTEKLDVSIPIHLGFGKSNYTYKTNAGNTVVVDDHAVVLYEPSMLAIYKPIRYLGVGVGIGYRLMLKNNKAIEERFTSPTYTLRLQIFFGQIWRDIRSNSD